MGVKKVSKKTADSLDDFEDEFKKIGARLRQLRQKAGFTSAEKFSNEHGFDRRTYGQWENGASMSVHSLLRVVQKHGITLEQFFAMKVQD